MSLKTGNGPFAFRSPFQLRQAATITAEGLPLRSRLALLLGVYFDLEPTGIEQLF